MTIQSVASPTREAFSRDELQGQVNRISRSAAFEHSQTLRRLLEYLAAKSIEAPGEHIKEYTIGVESLERRPSFDPKEDTLVRVQTHRLREKLREYYETEGIDDPILVTIPKGCYLPAFNASRSSLPPALQSAPLPPDALGGKDAPAAALGSTLALHQESRRRFNGIGLVGAGIALLAVLCVLAGWSLGRRSNPEGWFHRSSPTALAKADAVQTFWAAILGNDSAPVIVFTDYLYLLDNSNDLFPYPQGAVDNRGAPVDPNLARRYASNPSLVAKAGNVYYESGFTGTGDLKGAAALERLCTRMGVTPTVKSIRDLTTEDLKGHNIIVLGSTLQHVAAEQLVPHGDFVFGKSTEGHEGWGTEIVNLRPEPTEAAVYKTERDPNTHVLRADYGLISIQPGIVPGRYIVTLAGSDTTGTEGAALFATSKSGIEAVLSGSNLLAGDIEKNQAPIFQALVRVNLAKGSDVLSSSLITVHVSPAKGTAAPATP
jgi:hypothetical protein